MLLLLSLSVLISAVLGQQCCTPDVWEGGFHSGVGYVTAGMFDPKYLRQHDFVIYEYTEKMSAYFHHSFYEDGTERSFKMLAHFNEKRGYFIEENNCYDFNITRSMRKFCVPDSAKTLPQVFYGAGEHTLQAKRYYDRVTDESGNDMGAKLLTVTEQGCIPIENLEYREDHTHGGRPTTYDSVRGGTFADIVPEVTDRNELQPPPTCTTIKHMPSELQHLPSFQMWFDLISE